MYTTTEISEILTILRNIQPILVGIDGVDGSGKSTLASLLSKELGWPHINLDDYLDKNMGRYAEHIYYDQVGNILNKKHEPMIIEGVCILDVIEKLGKKLDTLICVKRMSLYGMWLDEDDCCVSEKIDEYISIKKMELQSFVEMEAQINGEQQPVAVIFPELAEEIIRYHYRIRPHDMATIVYERTDR